MSTVSPFSTERIFAIHRLRVNVKSLASEARIIRQETRRAGVDVKNGLANHRKGRLRREARLAHLALAYVRGMPYRHVEKASHDIPSADELLRKLSGFLFIPDRDKPNVGKWLRA